jgi:hypothetical protein
MNAEVTATGSTADDLPDRLDRKGFAAEPGG